MSAPGRRHGHGEVLHGCRVLGRTGIREGGHPHKASTMLAVFRGIAGQTLTPFALFEKRRNGVLRVFGALRRWRRSGPLRRVRPWPLRRCRRLSRPLKPGPEFPARQAGRWLGKDFSRRPPPRSSELPDTPPGLSASLRLRARSCPTPDTLSGAGGYPPNLYRARKPSPGGRGAPGKRLSGAERRRSVLCGGLKPQRRGPRRRC
jgi:hypothetical protein